CDRGRRRFALPLLLLPQQQALERPVGPRPEALVLGPTARVAQHVVGLLRMPEERSVPPGVGMVQLRDLEPAQADRLAGSEWGNAEDAIEIRPPPLDDGIQQHRGPVHYVFRRDATPPSRPTDLPVVGGAAGPGRGLEEAVQEHRLLVRAREELFGCPRVEDLTEPLEGRTPVAQHGSHPPPSFGAWRL